MDTLVMGELYCELFRIETWMKGAAQDSIERQNLAYEWLLTTRAIEQQRSGKPPGAGPYESERVR